MKVWTFAEVKKAAEDVLAEVGRDFVYAPGGRGLACYYAPTEPTDGWEWCVSQWSDVYSRVDAKKHSPCFVGAIIKKLGAMNEEIARSQGSVHSLSYCCDFTADPRATKLLELAQRAQDNGASWGEAYDRALPFAEAQGDAQ